MHVESVCISVSIRELDDPFSKFHVVLLNFFNLVNGELDLCMNVSLCAVNGDGGLSGRKHGLFLSVENILLMLCERALKESLGKSEMLNLRMSEGCVAKHALGNGDIVSTKERFITGAAGSLGADMKRASDGFAFGGIEVIETDRAGHSCNRKRLYGITEERKCEKNGIQFFVICMQKAFDMV